jgi:multiple sugar transport system permease protein
MIESGDQKMFEAFVVTVFYAVGIVPMQLGLALLLAVMLYQRIKGKDMYRMVYFMPYVTITVASAGVFRAIFSRRPESIANQVVGLFGIDPQKWLQEPHGIWELFLGHFGVNLQEVFKNMGVDSFLAFILAGPSLALLSIMLYNLWVFVGYNSVIFLAGLGAIPSDLYEAAEIDGANRWHIFRHVTLPLLSPTIYFLTIITVMGVFKAINHVLVMREPAAQGTVDTASLYIFDQFYLSTRFGYASAIAMVLFLVILTLTFIQNRIAQRRVFYG